MKKRVKDKRGFTLIELLVVIALMLSILGIAVVSFVGISNKKKESSKELIKEQIETAALEYFNANEFLFSNLKDDVFGVISVGKLVNDDYLNVVTNPVTGKRRRGRPRKIKNDNDLEDKIKVPDEVQKVIDIVKETKQKEDKEFHQVVEEVKKERKGEWDISIGDPIDFFDSRLSYELTGYKPIDRTHGLDFDPSWFTETRDTFNKTGHYCQYHFGSKLYRDFWDEQYRRCREGMESHGYRITGDHYFFLNFYRLKDLTKTTKAGSGRIESFADFFLRQTQFQKNIAVSSIFHK